LESEKREQAPAQPVASRPHGLPQGSEELLPWSWAESRLVASHVYWLATTRPDGRPHLMPIWGVWRASAFYFNTGRASRKSRNLERNASCVIATDQAREAVVVEGVAHVVTDLGLREQLLSLLQEKYDYDWSSLEDDISSLREPIYAVSPQTVFALDEQASMQPATRWRFR